MSLDKYEKIKENTNLRNKLLCLGINPLVINPKENKDDIAVSSNESIFFASFIDSNTSGIMNINNTWLIPNPSNYFLVPNDTEVEVTPGIYEIDLSGYISGVDTTHSGQFYLVTSDGSAIHDLTFELSTGNISEMYFSKNILFRFEENTILEVAGGISGNLDTSNVKISNVTLLMKKIHE